MGYDRKEDDRFSVPPGCSELDKEIGSIIWISNSLMRVQKLPSSKRRDKLVSALNICLGDLTSLEALEAQFRASKEPCKDCKLLRAELSEAHQEIDELMKVSQSHGQSSSYLDDSLHEPRWRWWLWKIVSFRTLIIIALLVQLLRTK